MNKKVLYTAIFGGYDELKDPKIIPEGWDFVCFTDSDIKSKVWQVRKVKSAFEDPTRNARMYKLLPHRFLGGYDTSVWMDGNLLLRGDLNEMLEEHLKNKNMAVFNHKYALHADKNKTPNPRTCVYEEAQKLLEIQEKGRKKDDPDLIKKQVERYRKEGYPENNGLILSMILLRRHNELDVIKTMEKWWRELKKGSKRDQLSFNYSAWKTDLDFKYINENVRNNKYFKYIAHRK